MVEYQIVALMVVGSSPIVYPYSILALLAELVDASDLKFVPYNKGVGSTPIQSIKVYKKLLC